MKVQKYENGGIFSLSSSQNPSKRNRWILRKNMYMFRKKDLHVFRKRRTCFFRPLLFFYCKPANSRQFPLTGGLFNKEASPDMTQRWLLPFSNKIFYKHDSKLFLSMCFFFTFGTGFSTFATGFRSLFVCAFGRV